MLTAIEGNSIGEMSFALDANGITLDSVSEQINQMAPGLIHRTFIAPITEFVGTFGTYIAVVLVAVAAYTLAAKIANYISGTFEYVFDAIDSLIPAIPVELPEAPEGDDPDVESYCPSGRLPIVHLSSEVQEPEEPLVRLSDVPETFRRQLFIYYLSDQAYNLKFEGTRLRDDGEIASLLYAECENEAEAEFFLGERLGDFLAYADILYPNHLTDPIQRGLKRLFLEMERSSRISTIIAHAIQCIDGNSEGTKLSEALDHYSSDNAAVEKRSLIISMSPKQIKLLSVEQRKSYFIFQSKMRSLPWSGIPRGKSTLMILSWLRDLAYQKIQECVRDRLEGDAIASRVKECLHTRLSRGNPDQYFVGRNYIDAALDLDSRAFYYELTSGSDVEALSPILESSSEGFLPNATYENHVIDAIYNLAMMDGFKGTALSDYLETKCTSTERVTVLRHLIPKTRKELSPFLKELHYIDSIENDRYHLKSEHLTLGQDYNPSVPAAPDIANQDDEGHYQWAIEGFEEAFPNLSLRRTPFSTYCNPSPPQNCISLLNTLWDKLDFNHSDSPLYVDLDLLRDDPTTNVSTDRGPLVSESRARSSINDMVQYAIHDSCSFGRKWFVRYHNLMKHITYMLAENMVKLETLSTELNNTELTVEEREEKTRQRALLGSEISGVLTRLALAGLHCPERKITDTYTCYQSLVGESIEDLMSESFENKIYRLLRIEREVIVQKMSSRSVLAGNVDGLIPRCISESSAVQRNITELIGRLVGLNHSDALNYVSPYRFMGITQGYMVTEREQTKFSFFRELCSHYSPRHVIELVRAAVSDSQNDSPVLSVADVVPRLEDFRPRRLAGLDDRQSYPSEVLDDDGKLCSWGVAEFLEELELLERI